MTHKPGNVAIFISCDDRETLDKLRAKVERHTGYPISLKAIVSKAIETMDKATR